MANIRIKDLPERFPSSSDWLAADMLNSGVFTTSKARVSAYFAAASNPAWTSTAQTVYNLSGNWEDVYDDYFAWSSRYKSGHTTLQATSGLWQTAYITILTREYPWNIAAVQAQNLTLSVTPVSANWSSVYTTVRANSGSWDTTYAKKAAFTIGDGINTVFTVNHNLNTRDVHVEVYLNTGSYATVAPISVTRPNTSSVTVAFSTPPGTNGYRVVVTG